MSRDIVNESVVRRRFEEVDGSNFAAKDYKIKRSLYINNMSKGQKKFLTRKASLVEIKL